MNIFSDEQLLEAYRATRLDRGEQLTYQAYKDGIDIERPSFFYRALAEHLAKLPIVQYTDQWGAVHTLTLDAAVRELKAWEDAWPGGPAEVEAALRTAKG